MEYLYGTASSVTRDLVCVAVNELRYPCCFNNQVEDLQIEKDKLDETSNRVQQRIEHDKKQTIETDERVQTWLEEANTDVDNAEDLLKKARTNKSCCFGHCPNWIWQYSLGKQLSQRRRMIETRNTEGREHAYKQTERRASLPGLGYYFNSEKCLKFKSRKNAYEQLMEALKSDQVNMIGMYGMGGCGKSTLAKEVGWRAKKEGLFDVVLYVSSTDQVQSIQEEIASQLEGFELQEKGERQRAQRLYVRLIQEEKLLVILDNVWEKLDFEAIGIAFPKNHKGCKVLITTRDQGVCNGMDCQRIISLPLLTDEEAWDLFQIKAQITSDNLNHLARLISNECKRLTVLVTAVASTLKGKDEVVWKVALERLKNSIEVNVEKGVPNLYECLKLSYDNLDNEEAKSIFLLCCVFPQEHEIPVEDLTRFAIGLGLVREVHSYDGARNEVCAAKEKLISSSLLDPGIPGQGKCVKMHDLIRQVALRVAEDEGKGIKCALKKDVTMENTSLRYLWCEKFPYQLDWSNLEFLCLNTYDLEVLDETFKGMEKLRVLFLVNKGLEMRPLLTKSFQSLTNLRCLLLEQWKLGDISFLGDPKKLESITLRRCSFSELPDILVTQRSSLRLLDLSECDMERNLLQVIIGKHPQLEELYISDCRSEWDPYDEGTAEFFRKFSIPQALQRYHIQLGEYQEKLLSCCKTLILSCFDTSNAEIKELAKKTEVLLIANIQGGGAKNIIPDIFQIDEGGMN